MRQLPPTEDDAQTHLFHYLGKLLNNKRYDTSKSVSRRFTAEELRRLDPPFYFNPVSLFKESRFNPETVES